VCRGREEDVELWLAEWSKPGPARSYSPSEGRRALVVLLGGHSGLDGGDGGNQRGVGGGRRGSPSDVDDCGRVVGKLGTAAGRSDSARERLIPR
jgi:hypothetical protein